MPSTLDYQITQTADGWQLSAGGARAIASDLKHKQNGAIVCRLLVASDKGLVFTDDQVNLTASRERMRVSKCLAKAGVTLNEGALLALEQALQQAVLLAPEAPPSGGESTSKPKATILDDAPLTLGRPLSIVGDSAYAAVPLHISTKDEPILAIIREDGRLYSPESIEGAETLQDLGFNVRVQTSVIPQRHHWSGYAVRAYLEGRRPDAADVFERLVSVIDHHVMFVRSLGAQREMCEMLAAYILHTWTLEGFNVAAYIWIGGEKGSGKSTVLKITCQLAFLGQELTTGSSLPALRDLSDSGSLLGLDDAEQLTNPKDMDAGKSELLLSGNKRGASTIVKEPAPSGKNWVVRHVSIFSPRMFSAIGTPPAALASRCIRIPMCRTNANVVGDPYDDSQWPTSRKDLINDLWALGLSSLRRIRTWDRQLLEHTTLVGRALEPWRGILTIALWLQEDCGVSGLFDRMTQLSMGYQKEREDLEAEDPARIAIRCVGEMLENQTDEHDVLIFTTSELVAKMNTLGKELEVIEDGREYDVRRVGKLLARLRFARPVNKPGKKRWQINRAMYRNLAVEHGITSPQAQPPGFPLVPGALLPAGFSAESPNVAEEF